MLVVRTRVMRVLCVFTWGGRRGDCGMPSVLVAFGRVVLLLVSVRVLVGHWDYIDA